MTVAFLPIVSPKSIVLSSPSSDSDSESSLLSLESSSLSARSPCLSARPFPPSLTPSLSHSGSLLDWLSVVGLLDVAPLDTTYTLGFEGGSFVKSTQLGMWLICCNYFAPANKIAVSATVEREWTGCQSQRSKTNLGIRLMAY